jgi:nitrogen regulatory protein P-II 1
MKRVICFLRPHRLEPVKSAVAALGVSGLTVSDVRGTGNSPVGGLLLGSVVALPIRSRLEAVVPDALVEPVIEAILESAHSGEAGDGKIFVEPILDAVRVRTGERGESAV